jgi:opacity protein-like surface antigen
MVAMRSFCWSPVLICGFHLTPSVSAQFSYPEGVYGWYEAGAAIVDKAKLRDFPGEATANNPVKFDPGFHFGMAIGHELTRYLSVEVESGFNYNALRSIGGATDSSANFYRVPVLGNLVLKYPNRSRLIPIIGAGAGAHWSVFDAQDVTVGLTTLSDDEETWTFGYQGFAGVCYKFRENMSVGAFYHYSVVDGPSWDFDSSGGNFKLDSLRTHSVALTFGWYF